MVAFSPSCSSYYPVILFLSLIFSPSLRLIPHQRLQTNRSSMKKTHLMGILNVTPDSFYENSRFFNPQAAIVRGVELVQQGADILDIGGESSRPRIAYGEGSQPISDEEEISRVVPVIKELKKLVTVPISVDTKKPTVAEAALKEGASLINDITGFEDPDMRRLAAESGCSICVMHMQGTPANMQVNPTYEEGIIPFLEKWFENRIASLLKDGIDEKQIILDPGIGYGKTVAHNLEIIHNLPRFKAWGFPLLLGVSRKIFMSKILQKPATELLISTLAVNTLAIESGVDYIRVHDVAEHRTLIDFFEKSAHHWKRPSLPFPK